MNTRRLVGLYPWLSVWERIPLMFAAQERSDEAESRRLFDTSPIRTWRFAEHLLAEQALNVLASIYIAEQLEAAAQYFFALWRLDDPEDPRPEEWLQAAQTDAYFFTVNAESWRRFCSDLGISSEALTAANHRGRFLRYCEENMPANAPSAAELNELIPEFNQAGKQLVTAEVLLASWRDLLQQMTRHRP